MIGLLGILVAIGLWWIYFDLVSHRRPISRRTQLWQYLHPPFAMAVAAGGAGILNTVEHAGGAEPTAVRWLLVGSLSVALASVAAITLTLEAQWARTRTYRSARVALLVSAA